MTTKIDTTLVTEEQIACCHRTINNQTGEVFYQVESESALNEDGTTKIYKVTYSRQHGFQCTCPAGAQGFASCTVNPTCKHVRWACAAAQEHKAEEARAARVGHLVSMGLTQDEACAALTAQVTINGGPADDETLVRVYGKGRPTDEEMERQAKEDHLERIGLSPQAVRLALQDGKEMTDEEYIRIYGEHKPYWTRGQIKRDLRHYGTVTETDGFTLLKKIN